MKTDKELLELAAKAAGYSIKAHEDGTLYSDCRCAGYWGVWNPLTDDGDAFRLASQLYLIVDTSLGRAIEEERLVLGHNNWVYGDMDFEFDDLAATRRAIVRAAAAIGERL